MESCWQTETIVSIYIDIERSRHLLVFVYAFAVLSNLLVAWFGGILNPASGWADIDSTALVAALVSFDVFSYATLSFFQSRFVVLDPSCC